VFVCVYVCIWNTDKHSCFHRAVEADLLIAVLWRYLCRFSPLRVVAKLSH